MKRVMPKAADVTEEADTNARGIVININENWRLLYDSRQYQVQERKHRKSDESVYWVTHAYISDLDNAIVWLSRKRIYLSSGVYDGRALIEICKTLDAIKLECTTAFRNALDATTKERAGTLKTPVPVAAPAVPPPAPEPVVAPKATKATTKKGKRV